MVTESLDSFASAIFVFLFVCLLSFFGCVLGGGHACLFVCCSCGRIQGLLPSQPLPPPPPLQIVCRKCTNAFLQKFIQAIMLHVCVHHNRYTKQIYTTNKQRSRHTQTQLQTLSQKSFLQTQHALFKKACKQLLYLKSMTAVS